jgi:hypothetical protein
MCSLINLLSRLEKREKECVYVRSRRRAKEKRGKKKRKYKRKASWKKLGPCLPCLKDE